jgi:membrane-bound ClpP family serine protease
MIFTIFGLTILGFALILIDLIFIPGGVLVVTGVVLIGYSIFLNYTQYGWIPTLIHALLCLALTPKIIVWSLSRLGLRKEMKAEDGFVSLPDRTCYIGLKGVVKSTLRPTGTVVVTYKNKTVFLDCLSESGFIDPGREVEIIKENGPSLIVRALES